MKKLFLALALLCLMYCTPDKTEKDRWEVYIAEYEAGPGSTTLNMDLIHSAPQKALPFIVITGVTYQKCRPDGFPETDELETLYQISDDVKLLVSGLTASVVAGSFTHQCQRSDYIYVKDTADIRTKLAGLYEEKYSDFAYFTKIKPDPDWKNYLAFLFPNEETREYMTNEKILMQLQEAGDDLSKARPVDHWLYFKDVSSRARFVQYAKQQGFTLEEQAELDDNDLPFSLHISRMDLVGPASINALTLKLRKKAGEMNGQYDGWETYVIRE